VVDRHVFHIFTILLDIDHYSYSFQRACRYDIENCSTIAINCALALYTPLFALEAKILKRRRKIFIFYSR